MGVNITTIDYLRVLNIEIGSTIILIVVAAQGWTMEESVKFIFKEKSIGKHQS